MNFCTLFDRNYLDRGIALYNSLNKNCMSFSLYILCLDETTINVLTQMNLKNVYLIPLNKILDTELSSIYQSRTHTAFCWTCAGSLIKYVLDTYQIDICTYIDADMYFYRSPRKLIDAYYKNEASIGIIEHRFNHNSIGRYYEKNAGKYCVQFNTFSNDERGMQALKWWRNQCISECTSEPNGKTFGDQKYLDDWIDRFKGVYVYDDVGAGMAPWNISQYKLSPSGMILLKGKEVLPIFYHFHGIKFENEKANIGVFSRSLMTDRKIVMKFYIDYLKEIQTIRQFLSTKYEIKFSNKWNIKSKQITSKRIIKDIITNFDVSKILSRIYKYLYSDNDVIDLSKLNE